MRLEEGFEITFIKPESFSVPPLRTCSPEGKVFRVNARVLRESFERGITNLITVYFAFIFKVVFQKGSAEIRENETEVSSDRLLKILIERVTTSR